MTEYNRDQGHYIPTPEEIRRGRIAIQEGWSEAERLQRIVGDNDKPRPYTVPEVRYCGNRQDLSE